MRFRTTILETGKSAAGIRIPDDVLDGLAAGKKPAVSLTLDGHYTYRSTVATVNGVPMVGFSADNRAASGISGGQEVDVDIELDTAPRTVDVPSDLGAALDADAGSKAFFDSLSYSHKRWHTLQIEGTKNPETRRRRLEKSMAMLRERRKP